MRRANVRERLNTTESSRAPAGQTLQRTVDLQEVDGAPHNKCRLIS